MTCCQHLPPLCVVFFVVSLQKLQHVRKSATIQNKLMFVWKWLERPCSTFLGMEVCFEILLLVVHFEAMLVRDPIDQGARKRCKHH